MKTARYFLPFWVLLYLSSAMNAYGASVIRPGIARPGRFAGKSISLSPARKLRLRRQYSNQPRDTGAACTYAHVDAPHRWLRAGMPNTSLHVRVTSNITFSPTSYRVSTDYAPKSCNLQFCEHPADRFQLYTVEHGHTHLVAARLRAHFGHRKTAEIILPPEIPPGIYKIGLIQGKCFLPPAGNGLQERGYQDTGVMMTNNSFRLTRRSDRRAN